MSFSFRAARFGLLSVCLVVVAIQHDIYAETELAVDPSDSETDSPVTPKQRADAIESLRAAARQRVLDLASNGTVVSLSLFGRMASIQLTGANEDGVEGQYDGDDIDVEWKDISDSTLGRMLLDVCGGTQAAEPADVFRAGALIHLNGGKTDGAALMDRALSKARSIGDAGAALTDELSSTRAVIFGVRKSGLSGISAASASAAPATTSKAVPLAVPTFHCIGFYWSPDGGAADKRVLIQYRKAGAAKWLDGLPLIYRPIPAPECKGDYRGSLVNLIPGAEYEIILTLDGTDERAVFKATTWSETFPIGSTVKVNSQTETYTINRSGKPDAYVLFDGTGSELNIGKKAENGIYIDASYVIVRGFTIRNPSAHGIRINGGHHIIVENCDISEWGSAEENGFGINSQAGVFCNKPDVTNVVIQRCKIHHPSHGSNSWAEKNGNSFHPGGPQTIFLWEAAGNHVIRYNEFWSKEGHYFNDVLGSGHNSSYRGFPGADSDIYCNYVANCWDDGIEVEGGGQNVRIWNNYIENVYLPIGNASNSIGPLYIWRNVSGRSFSPKGSEWGEYAPFLKMGYANSISYMSGHYYVFNNTVYQDKSNGAGGLGGSSKPIKNCTSRNNIFHLRTTDRYGIASSDEHENNDFDYDLVSGRYPQGQEKKGITGAPKYVPTAGFSFDSMSGNFQLAPGSRGLDEGIIIPNFCDEFKGTAPDMGAHEAGVPPLQYGVTATFIPGVNE
ncbi:MAG: right-handed parallel beta-helix repeat-containing protein [Planctomycetota bacterium]